MLGDTDSTNLRKEALASGDSLAVQVVRVDEVRARENLMTEEHTTDRPEDIGNDWDMESAVRRPGVKQNSVVVSVRLRRNDFDKISGCAEVEGVPTSTFMRNAALEKVEGRRGTIAVFYITGAATPFMQSAAFGYTTCPELRDCSYQVSPALQG